MDVDTLPSTPQEGYDVLQEAMSLIGLLSQKNADSFSHDAVDESSLSDLSYKDFMEQGLTLKLMKRIIMEYGEKVLNQFQRESLTDFTSVQFLRRYDTVSSQSLSEQLNAATTDVYHDEVYSLTNFSSKLMHDLNTLRKKTASSCKPMKDYMIDVGIFLKKNIYLCKNMGSQNDKHNLPGLYYRLLMVHLTASNKIQRRTRTALNEENMTWQPYSSLIFYQENFYVNITLLVLYALIHVEHALRDITLLIFSQYVIRIIQPAELTVGGHTAAHVAVMCQDVPGMLAMLNKIEMWSCKDNEGLLPVEHALLGMLHTPDEASIMTFVVACIKSELHDKVWNIGAVINAFDQKRIDFMNEVFKFIMQLDCDRLLDLTSSIFLGLYGEVWNETKLISQIPASLDFQWSTREHFFHTLNKIYVVMPCCKKSNLLEIIASNCLLMTQQQKVQLLREDFSPIIAIPMVLEEIKAKVIYNSYFGCPRKLLIRGPNISTNLQSEDTAEPMSLDRREYAALFLNWCPFTKNVAAKYNYSLRSAKTLNDSDSMYSYCFLLGILQLCTDIEASINLMKDKVRTIGGNGKPFRFLKRKRTDGVLNNSYLLDYDEKH